MFIPPDSPTFSTRRVRTRVKGSSAPFYNVSITFAPCSASDVAAVRTAITSDPLLTAEIVSGNLPVGLLTELEESGVQVLPRNFQELDGQCNCPDNAGGGGSFHGYKRKSAADPCKHQAACFFELIGELDRNPHTLLALRGIDVKEIVGVEEAGESGTGAGVIAYPLPTKAFQVGEGDVGEDERDDGEDGMEGEDAKGRAVKLGSVKSTSFPQLHNSSRVIVQSLSPSPAFYKDDFSAILAAFYSALSQKKIAQSPIGKTADWEKKLDVDGVRPILERAKFTLSFPDSFSIANVRVFIESDLWSLSEDVQLQRPTSDKAEKNASVKKEEEEEIAVVFVEAEDTLVMDDGGVDVNEGVGKRDVDAAAKTPMETLSTIPFEFAKPSERDGASPRVRVTLDTLRRLLLSLPSDGKVGSPSFLFFFYCMRAALLMFSSSNMVPDVAPVGSAGAWTVIYRPFMSDKAVAECVQKLERIFPRDESCVRLRSKGDAEGAVMLAARAGVSHTLCGLLSHLVCAFDFNGKTKTNLTPVRGKFLAHLIGIATPAFCV